MHTCFISPCSLQYAPSSSSYRVQTPLGHPVHTRAARFGCGLDQTYHLHCDPYMHPKQNTTASLKKIMFEKKYMRLDAYLLRYGYKKENPKSDLSWKEVPNRKHRNKKLFKCNYQSIMSFICSRAVSYNHNSLTFCLKKKKKFFTTKKKESS